MPKSEFVPIGAIIAGGQSTRMGNIDKLSLELENETLLARAIKRMGQQANAVLANVSQANSSLASDANAIVHDETKGHCGPLAGLSGCLNWVEANRSNRFTHLITAAADTPFYPADLVEKFAASAKEAPDRILIAHCEGYNQPIFGAWPIDRAKSMADFLSRGETFKVMAYVRSQKWQEVEFPVTTPHPFFNINTPDDLNEAKSVLTGKAHE